MPKHTIKITTLSVMGVIEGGKITLIDQDGRPISRRIDPQRLGQPDKCAALAWSWRRAAERMLTRLLTRAVQREVDPWQRKAQNLVASFRIRKHDRPYLGGRRRFEKYQTSTWDKATKRMWQQGHNRFRRYDRSSWVLWSHTVSSNQNKRADAWRTKRA